VNVAHSRPADRLDTLDELADPLGVVAELDGLVLVFLAVRWRLLDLDHDERLRVRVGGTRVLGPSGPMRTSRSMRTIRNRRPATVTSLARSASIVSATAAYTTRWSGSTAPRFSL
jgi:hypothetical protein